MTERRRLLQLRLSEKQYHQLMCAITARKQLLLSSYRQREERQLLAATQSLSRAWVAGDTKEDR